MSNPYLWSIGSALVVSLISLIGVFTLSLREQLLRRYTFAFVGLAVGALLGDAFIHLIPEALENGAGHLSISLTIIAGLLLFFILEKFLHWHHHGLDQDEHHHTQNVGRLILISDGLHNLIDGLLIGASYLVSVELGLATTLAVILHEIPQEIGDFGVLLHAGYTKRRALWLNFLSAALALAGVLIALLLSQTVSALTLWLIPLAAGGFIYIAVADLIPELHKNQKLESTVIQIISILVGVMIMVALAWWE